VHNQLAPGLGKIGILVGLESTADAAALEALGKQLAMHIAAAQPQAVDKDSLDPEVIERERQIQKDMARESGKPEEIIEKMVEGRMQKFYSENTLLHQVWVIDGESKVAKVLEQAEKELGAPVKVAGFVRFALGEGVEKEEQDFAAEVAATLGN
jgi:elongation factor Ts